MSVQHFKEQFIIKGCDHIIAVQTLSAVHVQGINEWNSATMSQKYFTKLNIYKL